MSAQLSSLPSAQPSDQIAPEPPSLSAPPRIAVVGAGPAGLYAADILLGQVPTAQIDVFEALPSPFGLIRYGVAPDHPRIKSIVDSLHQILDHGAIRFFGNVKVGADISLAQLHRYYDAVLLATGALRDAPFSLPGAELPGWFGGADFVAWYDSHPWYPQTWRLDAKEVAVIGMGNVALDIARVLARRPEDLARTDMPPHVLEVFKNSPLTDIHIFGRRGPAGVKFSPLELRELGHVPGVQMVVDADGFDFDAADQSALAANGRLRQAVKTLQGWSQTPGSTEERRIHLHFYWRPERLEGIDAVTGITMRRTAPDGQGGVVDTDATQTFPVQAVYRAVGYFGSPLEGAPFDADKGVIPNISGRVVQPDGSVVPGLYVTGWIKRGPVGLIGSTKSDALETIGHLVQDLETLPTAPERNTEALVNTLRQQGVGVVTWEGWLAVDAAERAQGVAEGRERAKFATTEEMTSWAHTVPGKCVNNPDL